jgi:hypothetical protein
MNGFCKPERTVQVCRSAPDMNLPYGIIAVHCDSCILSPSEQEVIVKAFAPAIELIHKQLDEYFRDAYFSRKIQMVH